MIYECDECGKPLPAGVAACPVCGEVFDEPVPADAEMPKQGFTSAFQPPAAPASGPACGGGQGWLDRLAQRRFK